MNFALLANEVLIQTIKKKKTQRGITQHLLTGCSGKIYFVKPSKETVAFGLTTPGDSLVFGSNKTHVALEPSP